MPHGLGYNSHALRASIRLRRRHGCELRSDESGWHLALIASVGTERQISFPAKPPLLRTRMVVGKSLTISWRRSA